MPSMEEQVRAALTTIKEYHDRRGGSERRRSSYPLGMERDIVVLWGMYRGWSNRVIADATRASGRTIRRLVRRFANRPSLIFECPILHQGLRGKRRLYRCEFCGALMVISERKAREHVASHLFPREVIAVHGVMPQRTW